MQTRIVVALVATWMATVATPARAAVTHGPPYAAGPKGGDAHTHVDADPATGRISIFQDNTRQAAAVHCVGEGPFADLEITHVVADPVSSVKVNYADAVMTDNPVINVIVTGSRSGWLGHGQSLGPKLHESGTIDIPLQGGPPVPGETLTVIFGLQVHAGCLPHPLLLGLAGSRPVEGGTALFPSVEFN